MHAPFKMFSLSGLGGSSCWFRPHVDQAGGKGNVRAAVLAVALVMPVSVLMHVGCGSAVSVVVVVKVGSNLPTLSTHSAASNSKMQTTRQSTGGRQSLTS